MGSVRGIDRLSMLDDDHYDDRYDDAPMLYPLIGKETAEQGQAYDKHSKLMMLITKLEQATRDSIENVQILARNLHTYARQIENTTSGKQDGRIAAHVTHIIDQVKLYMAEGKESLTALQDLTSEHDGSLGGREKAYCTAVINRLNDDFAAAVKDMLHARGAFEEAGRNKMVAQLKIVFPNMDDDAAAKLASGDDPVHLQKLMEEQGAGGGVDVGEENEDEAPATQADVDRLTKQQKALAVLATSVNELRECFVWMETLTNQQTDTLGNIEDFVNTTAEYTGEGVKRLQKAEKHQATYEATRASLLAGFGKLKMLMYVIVVILVIMLCCWLEPFIKPIWNACCAICGLAGDAGSAAVGAAGGGAGAAGFLQKSGDVVGAPAFAI